MGTLSAPSYVSITISSSINCNVHYINVTGNYFTEFLGPSYGVANISTTQGSLIFIDTYAGAAPSSQPADGAITVKVFDITYYDVGSNKKGFYLIGTASYSGSFSI